MAIPIVILAAGGSKRMGQDKLMMRILGVPLLRRVADRAVLAGAEVCVTLRSGTSGEKRRSALQDLPDLKIIKVPDANEGLSASLRAAVAALKYADGIIVAPADMPELTVEDFRQIWNEARAQPDRPLKAVDACGTAGHPTYLPNRLFAGITALTGDVGARHLLQGQSIGTVQLPDHHATTDLDTPQDWAAWADAQKT